MCKSEPKDPADSVHKCDHDTEVQLITLNAWIERHWKKLLRVPDVLVGPPGAVVALIPPEFPALCQGHRLRREARQVQAR